MSEKNASIVLNDEAWGDRLSPPRLGSEGGPLLSLFSVLLEVFTPFHAVRHEDKTKQERHVCRDVREKPLSSR